MIAGSRELKALRYLTSVCDHVLKNKSNVEVVSGCARGADRLGEVYAYSKGWSVKRFPADWDTHGKSAGMIRNKQMAEYADAAIVIMVEGAGNKGSQNMVECAEKAGIPVKVYKYTGE